MEFLFILSSDMLKYKFGVRVMISYTDVALDSRAPLLYWFLTTIEQRLTQSRAEPNPLLNLENKEER